MTGMTIDTTNDFLVGVQGDNIRMLRPINSRLNNSISKAEALRLAAWLVVLAEEEKGAFESILAAVKQT